MFRDRFRALPLAAALLCLAALPCLRPACGLAAQPAASDPAARALIINTDGVPPHSRPDGSGFEDRIVTEAFRRIGRAIVISRLASSERCLRNVDAGHDDGNYVRVAGVERQYQNLVMVPEPVSRFPFTAFTREGGPERLAWADLTRYRSGYAVGWKAVEAHLKDRPMALAARDEEALFALLAGGRVDVIVAGLAGGREIIRQKGYAGLRPVLPPLETRDMFLYLHRRHAGLAPALAEALRAMRKDGAMARLLREGGAEGAP